MKSLYLTESDEKITEKELQAFEKQLMAPLPTAMKEFYLAYNGGQPHLPCVHDKKHFFPFNSFYSLGEMTKMLKYFDDEALPSGFAEGELLHFGYGVGNFALSLRKVDFGKVYFYVLEETAEVYGEWSNFEEFINSFVAED